MTCLRLAAAAIVTAGGEEFSWTHAESRLNATRQALVARAHARRQMEICGTGLMP